MRTRLSSFRLESVASMAAPAHGSNGDVASALIGAHLPSQSFFGASCKAVTIVGNSQHALLRFQIAHVICQRTHFLGALAPMGRVVDKIWSHERSLRCPQCLPQVVDRL